MRCSAWQRGSAVTGMGIRKAPSRWCGGSSRLHTAFLVLAAVLVVSAAVSCFQTAAPSPPTARAQPDQPQPEATAPAIPGAPSRPPSSRASPGPTRPAPVPLDRTIEGYAVLNGCRLTLEIADTPQERGRGLMERDTLPRDHGMLFVYEEARLWGFWMLNTRIPLDVVWMDADGRVVDIRTMQPEPGVPQNQLTLYTPRGDALYALEANAGLAARVGLAVGNVVRLQAAADPPAAPECP